MEFLKELLGEELYKQLESKLNEHNGNEANKENQIKLANLGTGEYVGKGKYDNEVEKLNNIISNKDAEITSANNLIAELKKGTKGDEELQGKITGYETQVTELQNQLLETKIQSAVKVGLLAEGCTDVDYVTYQLMKKLKEKGETLELDENDGIKGWDDKVSGLKTQLPAQFKTAEDGKKILDNGKLPEGDGDRGGEPKTLADALRMQYESKQN